MRHRLRAWLPAFLLAAGGLLLAPLAGCNGSDETDVYQTPSGVLRLGSAVATDTVRRAVAPAGRTLVLDGARGRVTLRATRGSVATLRFVKEGRASTKGEAGSVLRGIRITETGTPEQYTYAAEIATPSRSAVSVVGTAPSETPLRVEDARGPVVLGGFGGAITVRHPFGSVRIEDARGPVDVAVQGGDVRVVFERIAPGVPITLRTGNGDLDVTLPPGTSARIDAETQVGRVQTQGLALTDQRLTPVGAGVQYTAQYGSGGPRLTLSTGNGRITLRRGARGSATPGGTPSGTPSDTMRAAPDTVRLTRSASDSVASDSVRADSVRADSASSLP